MFFFLHLQDPVDDIFRPTFTEARLDLAVWVDEYFLVFPEMPAAIAGLGINGIESTNGKLIRERAAKAEQQRLEELKAAKAAEDLALAERLLKDQMAEAGKLAIERDLLHVAKEQLSKQRKALEAVRYNERANAAAQKALTAGISACKKRYGYKLTDTAGDPADHFDQGYFESTQALSGWKCGVGELLPSPAVLVLSLLSMELDTSKPFEFKPNEWTWLSEAMDKVHAVIAVRIRAVHLCAMMTVLNALKYFVDSAPYVIGETIGETYMQWSAPRTELVTGYIITAAKIKKNLEVVMINAKGPIGDAIGGPVSELCVPKEIFSLGHWDPVEDLSPSGTFDAYTFRPDSMRGVSVLSLAQHRSFSC